MESLRNKVYRTLRWSEQYAKTDMVYIAKGGIWLSLGRGLGLISGLAVSIAFANLFPKESFGNYKFVLSMVGIVGAFSLSGVGRALIQSAAKGFDNSLRQGFRMNLKWGIGILVGGLILSGYYFIKDNFLLSFAFLVAGLLHPIISSANLYSSYLLGMKDFRRNSLYSIVHNIITAVILVSTLLITDNFLVLIGVYFLAGTVMSTLLYRKTLIAFKNNHDKEDPELFSYSGHLSIMGILGQIGSYLDKILVFHYLGATPLAIYAFAIAPVEQLQGGKKIFSNLVMPKLSQRPLDELRASTPRKSLILTAYALGLIAIYVLLIPYFFQFFYPQYMESVFYSQIYALTLLAISGTVFHETLVAHKKTRELYLHRTIIPVIKISLYFILLPIYGLMGLVIAHIITITLSSILAFYLVKHPFKTGGIISPSDFSTSGT